MAQINISIVIPLYNAEKYIGECLDSILKQTFQNYEIIIVDDCSTDESCNIVESYQSKFGDKLKLIHTEKNSGDGGLPRNIGIKASQGEYICFVDNDDAITETALEELHNLTENFQADVFYFEKYYRASAETVTTDKNLLKAWRMKEVDTVKEPTFMSDNLEERIHLFSENQISWAPWSFFIRRDFLLKNKIEFPSDTCLEDAAFVFYLICLAEKILIAPNIFYVWRQRHDSLTKNFSTPFEMMIRRIKSIFKLIGILDDFINGVEFFKQFPAYRYKIFEVFTRHNLDEGKVQDYFLDNTGYEIDERLRKDLDDIDNKNALIAFLFCRMNIWEALVNQANNQLIPSLNNRIKQQNSIIERQNVKIEHFQNWMQKINKLLAANS